MISITHIGGAVEVLDVFVYPNDRSQACSRTGLAGQRPNPLQGKHLSQCIQMQAWAKSRIILDDLPMIFLKLSIQKNGGNPSLMNIYCPKTIISPKMDCPSNDFPENI